MPRWSYMVELIDTVDDVKLTRRLNDIGRDGFELVSTNIINGKTLMFFKAKYPDD